MERLCHLLPSGLGHLVHSAAGPERQGGQRLLPRRHLVPQRRPHGLLLPDERVQAQGGRPAAASPADGPSHAHHDHALLPARAETSGNYGQTTDVPSGPEQLQNGDGAQTGD